jgi:hypothetical protein
MACAHAASAGAVFSSHLLTSLRKPQQKDRYNTAALHSHPAQSLTRVSLKQFLGAVPVGSVTLKQGQLSKKAIRAIAAPERVQAAVAPGQGKSLGDETRPDFPILHQVSESALLSFSVCKSRSSCYEGLFLFFFSLLVAGLDILFVGISRTACHNIICELAVGQLKKLCNLIFACCICWGCPLFTPFLAMLSMSTLCCKNGSSVVSCSAECVPSLPLYMVDL